MSNNKYYTVKVFEHIHMPTNVEYVFFEYAQNYNAGNGSYVPRYIPSEILEEFNDKYQLIDNWLLECGAIRGEKVLIQYSW